MNLKNISIKIKDNGVGFFLLFLSVRMLASLRGFFYSWLLGGGHFFEVGISPKIRGGRKVSIGRGCRFGDFFWLEAVGDYYGQKLDPRISIGDDVVINDFVHIAAANSVVIGSGCLIASKVLITDHSHGVYSGAEQSSPAEPPALRKLYSKGAVFIGENVWLGEYVSILPGARIGDGVIVGANSTVSGELPANTICVGSPARPVKIFSSERNAWVPFREITL